MKSTIITIGDELLIGQVINTNAAFIAERLNGAGVEVDRMLTVADTMDDILQSIQESFHRFDVIILTGGLGPTHDDVTKRSLCTFFNTTLEPNADARKYIERFLTERGHRWSPAAEEQTLFPAGAHVIPNHLGTASGIMFDIDNHILIAMPGVPYEMEKMVDETLVPLFRSRAKGKVVLHRTLKTTGIPESMLAGKLENIDAILEGSKLAFLPSPSGVRMRITVVDADRSSGERKIELIESRIRKRVEKYIYGVDTEELEEVIGRLLADKQMTIAVAESCTGGMIANKITNVPGSSVYFERGAITYSNRSKIEILGVPADLIKTYGAVSREVAEAMAQGIKSATGVSIGISTTGIAGPAGGSEEKPVGLVWIGYSDAKETIALKFQFGTGRIRVKERATQAALELVRRKLLQIN